MNYTGLTLEMAQKKYMAYLEAEEAILTSKEYELEGRRVTREDLDKVIAGMKYWEGKCNQLGSQRKPGIGVFRGIIKND